MMQGVSGMCHVVCTLLRPCWTKITQEEMPYLGHLMRDLTRHVVAVLVGMTHVLHFLPSAGGGFVPTGLLGLDVVPVKVTWCGCKV